MMRQNKTRYKAGFLRLGIVTLYGITTFSRIKRYFKLHNTTFGSNINLSYNEDLAKIIQQYQISDNKKPLPTRHLKGLLTH